MFEPVREDGGFVQIVGTLLVVWRDKWFRRLLLLFMICVIAGLGVWSWFWHVTLDAACLVPNVRSYSVQEFLALRDRKTAYQRSKERVSWMALNPDEVTFLVAESEGVFLEISAEGDQLEAQIGLPTPSGCYNLLFSGHVEIDDSVLRVVPRTFRIGDYDMIWLYRWVGPKTFGAEDLPNPKMSQMLTNTRTMKVESGQLHFRLRDKSMEWSFKDK